jgi:peptide/nickel transport system ATP-binding protein
MIAVEGLEVRFGRGPSAVHAVRGVTFAVPAGSSFGLVGESGSGKSTVLRALVGLLEPTAGTITIGGEPVGRSPGRAFRKKVQMIFQDPYGSLHPRHTIDRILREPIAIHKLDGGDARIVRALREVGLDASFRYRFPHQLSGGQRQRVAIARALVLEPRVLLLDEPTSALDVSIQAEILNLLSDLRAVLGLTYILVSHNLAVVGHMSEQVAIMNQGRIVETVPTESLDESHLASPYARQLLESSRGYDRELARRLKSFD